MCIIVYSLIFDKTQICIFIRLCIFSFQRFAFYDGGKNISGFDKSKTDFQ